MFPCVPQLSHDANETLSLHLFVKSYGKNIDSKLQGEWGQARVGLGSQVVRLTTALSSTVTLYNCSFGRSDCSLCLAADPAYGCVWCRGQSRCVYGALCSNATSECPPPVITKVGCVSARPVPCPHIPSLPEPPGHWALPISDPA